MPELTPTYDVILRSEMPPVERELFERLCCKVPCKSGELLQFYCTEVNVASPFLEMETFKPGDQETHSLMVPLHLVLLISGSESRRPFGFLRDEAQKRAPAESNEPA
jgi:hypothetical protein